MRKAMDWNKKKRKEETVVQGKVEQELNMWGNT
jgi:hypothetical protein